MPETLTLAELPPDVAEQVMKRIRVRLRPPLPPELTWEADDDQPGDGPPTETADVEFTSRGKGVVVHATVVPTVPRLVCEVPTEPEREGDQ
jgi:hypothetical protein